ADAPELLRGYDHAHIADVHAPLACGRYRGRSRGRRVCLSLEGGQPRAPPCRVDLFAPTKEEVRHVEPRIRRSTASAMAAHRGAEHELPHACRGGTRAGDSAGNPGAASDPDRGRGDGARGAATIAADPAGA